MAATITVFDLAAPDGPLGSYPTLAEASATLPGGAYTTFRSYRRDRIVRLERHLLRLEESVRLEGQTGQIDRTAIREALRAIVRRLAVESGDVRIRLTFAPPALFAACEPFVPPPPEAYERGVACVTIRGRRDNPRAKATSFIGKAAELRQGLGPGIEEGLLVDEDGAILEGLSSNFFAVIDDKLRTEDARVLAGVTRDLVLDAAAPLPVERIAATRKGVERASDCFITSVSRGILPVVRIDGRDVADGRPGRLTLELSRRFDALVEREAEPL